MDDELIAHERFMTASHDRRTRGTGSHALIVKAAQALPARDRALLEAVFQDGRSAAELARVRGVSPRHLSRTIRVLVKRVLSPEYRFVVANRRHWPRSRAKVATVCFVQGRGIREAARLARLTFHSARRHHDAVLALLSAEPPSRAVTQDPTHDTATPMSHTPPTPSQRGAA